MAFVDINSYNTYSRFPNLYMILSYLMVPAITIFLLFKNKVNRRSFFSILFTHLASTHNSKWYQFMQLSDETNLPCYFRSLEHNQALLSMLSQRDSLLVTFDADNFPLIFDSGASSSATAFQSDFIPNTYRKLTRVTISGIASGLQTAGIGSVLYKFKLDHG